MEGSWQKEVLELDTNLYFHMAKLADVTEAPLLLPQGADRLATHGRLTVSKRAAVTLKRQIATPKIYF